MENILSIDETDILNNSNREVIFIRHGESFINTFKKDNLKIEEISEDKRKIITDADLTSLGYSQAEETREKLKEIKIDLVYTSPLYRTLRTTQILFKNHPSNPKVVVLPLIREIFFSSHDIPKELSVIKSEFPSFDFSLIENLNEPDLWLFNSFVCSNKKEEFLKRYEESDEERLKKIVRILSESNNYFDETRLEIAQRCLLVKNIIEKEFQKGRDKIVLVSHAYFISTFIADDIDEMGSVKKRRIINNCEVVEFNLNKFSIKF
jgi:broad specificity phosphatase PhoE